MLFNSQPSINVLMPESLLSENIVYDLDLWPQNLISPLCPPLHMTRSQAFYLLIAIIDPIFAVNRGVPLFNAFVRGEPLNSVLRSSCQTSQTAKIFNTKFTNCSHKNVIAYYQRLQTFLIFAHNKRVYWRLLLFFWTCNTSTLQPVLYMYVSG